MPAELPGYYFDAVKNRYFKIQPNHIAPSGSNYSVQAVRAERAVKKARRQDELLYQSKLAETLGRSKLLQHPMLAFDRRLGHLRKSAGALVSEYYAAGLTGKSVFHDLQAWSPSPHESLTRWDGLGTRGQGVPTSGSFAIAEDSGTLFADCWWRATLPPDPAVYQTRMHAFHLRPPPAAEASHNPHWYVPGNYGTGAPYKYGNSEVFDLAESTRCILALGSDLVVWSELSTHFEVPTTSVVKVGACRFGAFGDRNDLTPRIGVPFVVLGLAARPGEYTAALVTERGFALMDLAHATHPLSRVPMKTSEMLKATFKDRNIVVGGTRSGQMLMCDIRVPGGATIATRLQHSDAVTGLAALPDGNRILLSGPRRMSIYDLRFAPPPTPVCHLPRSNSFQASPAVLDFVIPATYGTRRAGTNFTYDPELNVVLRTSTNDHRHHRAALWSASTGRLLPSPLNTQVFPEPIACAAIARIRDGPKGVVISSGKWITEWTPQGRGEADDDQE